jgi:hypothetical protein
MVVAMMAPITDLRLVNLSLIRLQSCITHSLAWKCQFLGTSCGVRFLKRYHIAPAPNRMPQKATPTIQTSRKQGVRSHRSSLTGPQPSLSPHSGCCECDFCFVVEDKSVTRLPGAAKTDCSTSEPFIYDYGSGMDTANVARDNLSDEVRATQRNRQRSFTQT